MADTPEQQKRPVRQPLCLTCSHPRSFHGNGQKCQALGCTECTAYVSPLTAEVEADAK